MSDEENAAYSSTPTPASYLNELKKRMITETKGVLDKNFESWASLIAISRDMYELAARFARAPVHFDDNDAKIEVVECIMPERAVIYDKKAKKAKKRTQKEPSLEQAEDPPSPKSTELLAEHPVPLVYQETTDLTQMMVTQPFSQEPAKKRYKRASKKRNATVNDSGDTQDTTEQPEQYPPGASYFDSLLVEPLKDLLATSDSIPLDSRPLLGSTNHCVNDDRIVEINKLIAGQGLYVVKVIDGVQAWYEVVETAQSVAKQRVETSPFDVQDSRPKTPEIELPIRIIASKAHKRPPSRDRTDLE